MLTYFSTQVLEATLLLTVFGLVACVLQPFEHWPVVPGPEGVVQSSKLYLLCGSPEMRDQELAGEKVPGSAPRGWQQREERRVEQWESMCEKKMQYNVGNKREFRETSMKININHFRMLELK